MDDACKVALRTANERKITEIVDILHITWPFFWIRKSLCPPCPSLPLYTSLSTIWPVSEQFILPLRLFSPTTRREIQPHQFHLHLHDNSFIDLSRTTPLFQWNLLQSGMNWYVLSWAYCWQFRLSSLPHPVICIKPMLLSCRLGSFTSRAYTFTRIAMRSGWQVLLVVECRLHSTPSACHVPPLCNLL